MIDKIMEEIFTGVVTVLNDGHSGVAPYKNYDEIRTILEKHLGLLESKMEPLGEVQWQDGAYTFLGFIRDDMSPSDVRTVQDFIKKSILRGKE